jgi:hypothetical protein
LPLTHTFVRTHTLMDAWAETWPTAEDIPCAVCGEPIPAREVCYYVTQLGRDEHDREQHVCWRHVRTDQGPLTV